MKVVQAHHRATVLQQRLAHVATEKPGTPRDHDSIGAHAPQVPQRRLLKQHRLKQPDRKLRASSCVIEEMKGDRVEIVVDAGGTTLSYEVVATRAGRRVEVSHGRGIVEVTELTRGGTAVRTARFMASRVLALVEHPASRTAEPDDESSRPG
jgi:hypothetical protein